MKIISLDTQGAFAQYFAVPERVCWKNDPDMPPELATVQEPMGNAMYALLGEDADVAGKTLAIIGDGPIALFACAMARVVGLAKIFVTGLSPVSLEIAKKVGADEALLVNPGSSAHVQTILDQTDGWGCDIVLDMTGTQPGIDDCFKVLRKGGRLSAFGVSSKERVTLDYNEGIVFKACQIHGINGRKIFDTWYRVSNLLKNGRLDVYPILTHMLPLKEFAKGFDLAREDPRRCSKVILFPDVAELEKAKARATGLLG
jgi:threonine 3-dehydrogenase